MKVLAKCSFLYHFFFLSHDFIKKKQTTLHDSVLTPYTEKITPGTQASGHTKPTLETKPIPGMPTDTYTTTRKDKNNWKQKSLARTPHEHETSDSELHERYL